MKIIRLTYQYSEIQPSVPVNSFFRMIGVYVRERYFANTIDVSDEIAEVRRMYADVQMDFTPIHYDAEVYLVNRNVYKEYTEKYKPDESQGVCVYYGDFSGVEDDIIPYGADKTNCIMDEILDQMFQKGILSDHERIEYQAILDAFFNFNYTALIYHTKFYYITDSSQVIEEHKRWYQDMVKGLQESYERLQNNLQKAGLYYIRYAVVNVAYEADLYCSDYNQSMLFSIKSLLDTLGQLEDEIQHMEDCPFSLNSIWTLTGEIYDNLMNHYNQAFTYYLKCCKDADCGNAYVYMLKGRYCALCKYDYVSALKYYLKSILIYPEYYRAWFKMGSCFLKMGDKDNAYHAFNAVIKILGVRQKEDVLRPLEVEYLYLAYEKNAAIVYKRGISNIASDALHEGARNVLEKIKDSRFYDLMLVEPRDKEGTRLKEKQDLIKEIQEQFLRKAK